MDIQERAKEISSFLELDCDYVVERLQEGFVYNHHIVAADFNLANPETDDELLNWYRNTTSYIFELSAYHLDEGFNYSGMCTGIATHLKNLGANRVLCLGDGIGDLSLTIGAYGLKPIYHDLAGSKTATFALYRFAHCALEEDQIIPDGQMTSDWTPNLGKPVDAVVALDFFEHLTNVDEWAQAVYEVLNPGGVFLAQNAFAIGDDDHGGSIPMHLVKNNKYETEWVPLLESIGFKDLHNGWWQK